MAYKRVNVPEGTDVGRKYPVDAVYEDEQGNRTHLEVSLDANAVLPEKCEDLPLGPGVKFGRIEFTDNPSSTPLSSK